MAQIARSDCVETRSNPGFVLRSDAAEAWDRACAAFGRRVLITGAWRSRERQVELFDSELHPDTGRYVRGDHRGKPGFTNDYRGPYRGSWWTRKKGEAAAAVPGTSNHGGGVAVDAKTRREDGDPSRDVAVVFGGWSDSDREAFLKVAAEHGWTEDEGAWIGGVYRGPNAEFWHLTYYPAKDKHRGEKPAAAPTIPTVQEEYDMRVCKIYVPPQSGVTSEWWGLWFIAAGTVNRYNTEAELNAAAKQYSQAGMEVVDRVALGWPNNHVGSPWILSGREG